MFLNLIIIQGHVQGYGGPDVGPGPPFSDHWHKAWIHPALDQRFRLLLVVPRSHLRTVLTMSIPLGPQWTIF